MPGVSRIAVAPSPISDISPLAPDSSAQQGLGETPRALPMLPSPHPHRAFSILPRSPFPVPRSPNPASDAILRWSVACARSIDSLPLPAHHFCSRHFRRRRPTDKQATAAAGSAVVHPVHQYGHVIKGLLRTDAGSSRMGPCVLPRSTSAGATSGMVCISNRKEHIPPFRRSQGIWDFPITLALHKLQSMLPTSFARFR